MSFFTVLVGSKIAMGALALGTLAAGGSAAVAYTGGLPTPLQESAHSLIGAPAPTIRLADTITVTETPTPTSEATETATPTPFAAPVGPDATGSAAFGLCEAYTHGGLAMSSTAYVSLAAAANGTANITEYCATIASPGQSASHRSTADANVSSDTTTQIVEPTAPQLPTQAGAGSAHKPATAGRP